MPDPNESPDDTQLDNYFASLADGSEDLIPPPAQTPAAKQTSGNNTYNSQFVLRQTNTAEEDHTSLINDLAALSDLPDLPGGFSADIRCIRKLRAAFCDYLHKEANTQRSIGARLDLEFFQDAEALFSQSAQLTIAIAGLQPDEQVKFNQNRAGMLRSSAIPVIAMVSAYIHKKNGTLKDLYQDMHDTRVQHCAHSFNSAFSSTPPGVDPKVDAHQVAAQTMFANYLRGEWELQERQKQGYGDTFGYKIRQEEVNGFRELGCQQIEQAVRIAQNIPDQQPLNHLQKLDVEKEVATFLQELQRVLGVQLSKSKGLPGN